MLRLIFPGSIFVITLIVIFFLLYFERKKNIEKRDLLSINSNDADYFKYSVKLSNYKDKIQNINIIIYLLYILLIIAVVLILNNSISKSNNIFWLAFFIFIYSIPLINKLIKSIKNYILKSFNCPHNIKGGYTDDKCNICVAEKDKANKVKQEKYLTIAQESTPQNTIKSIIINPKKTKSESPIEEIFYEQLKKHTAEDDFSLIIQQQNIGRYRVDFSIPSLRFVIELDGHNYHKSKKQRTNDAQRERYLQQNGWTVIRYTGSEIRTNINKCLDDFYKITKLNRINKVS